jgi:tripartite-type tricarboxylate transporter receptor subunit TctC
MYPNVPTVAEAGVPGYQSDVWYGVMVPAKTPADIVNRLNREILAILKSPDTKEKLASEGAEVIGGTPEQMATVLRNDIKKWAKLTAGMTLQMN